MMRRPVAGNPLPQPGRRSRARPVGDIEHGEGRGSTGRILDGQAPAVAVRTVPEDTVTAGFQQETAATGAVQQRGGPPQRQPLADPTEVHRQGADRDPAASAVEPRLPPTRHGLQRVPRTRGADDAVTETQGAPVPEFDECGQDARVEASLGLPMSSFGGDESRIRSLRSSKRVHCASTPANSARTSSSRRCGSGVVAGI
jgi:hypothetical protein